jgi:hypothetical protein
MKLFLVALAALAGICVVGLIAFSIAGPKQLIAAHEIAAIHTTKIIHQAMTQYYSQNGRYALDLGELSDLISPTLASGQDGYRFAVRGSADGYSISASPVEFGQTGKRTFYSDQTLVIRYREGPDLANQESPELP